MEYIVYSQYFFILNRSKPKLSKKKVLIIIYALMVKVLKDNALILKLKICHFLFNVVFYIISFFNISYY